MTSAPTISIEDLPQHLAREARLLGLDVGTKTIGLALSDVTRSVATPYDTMSRNSTLSRGMNRHTAAGHSSRAARVSTSTL